MDPRIGWYPNELICNAYSTWSNVWMVSQMNSHTAACNLMSSFQSAPNLNNANAHLHTSHSSGRFLSTTSSSSHNHNSSHNLLHNIASTPLLFNNLAGLNGTTHTTNENNENQGPTTNTAGLLVNGCCCHGKMNNAKGAARKPNKANTFGYNFPVNEEFLTDPMSTPWMVNFNTFQTVNFVPAGSYSGSSRCSSSLLSTSSMSNNSTNLNDESIGSNLLNTNGDGGGGADTQNSTTPNSTTSSSGVGNIYKLSENCYSEGLVNLHKEILLFTEYISPTMEELHMRNEIIMRITNVIRDQFPAAHVDVFGSYKTGLFLPTSDIDMVVLGEWKHPPLNQLKDALIRERISNEENIQVLDKASVPIIKILETKTDLKVDISFNTINGVRSAELIKQYLIDYPCLKPLVMVLKQFLIQRDFNEVWTGGIGSYSLILMIVSFLQLHPRIDAHSSLDINLGVLLIEFFEFYGRCFNYFKTAIRIQNGGCYMPKKDILKQFTNFGTNRSSILCIEDPLNTSNDIGKGSYLALEVKQAFEYAYLSLSYAVLPQNDFLLKTSSQSSILGRIIRITKEVREYREWVKKTYEKVVSLELAKSFLLLHHQNKMFFEHQQHQHHHQNWHKSDHHHQHIHHQQPPPSHFQPTFHDRQQSQHHSQIQLSHQMNGEPPQQQPPAPQQPPQLQQQQQQPSQQPQLPQPQQQQSQQSVQQSHNHHSHHQHHSHQHHHHHHQHTHQHQHAHKRVQQQYKQNHHFSLNGNSNMNNTNNSNNSNNSNTSNNSSHNGTNNTNGTNNNNNNNNSSTNNLNSLNKKTNGINKSKFKKYDKTGGLYSHFKNYTTSYKFHT